MKDKELETVKGLCCSVVILHGRDWGFQYDWLGWRRILSVGIGTNFLAPAIRIVFGSLSIWIGRIPKETRLPIPSLLGGLKD